MKNLKISFFVLAIAIAFAGCKGDKGDTGPAGASGTNGTNGNANVILAVFGSQNFSSSISYVTLDLPSTITSNMIDSSLVLVYHQSSGCGTNWYSSNGLGCAATYTSRIYTTGSNPVQLILQIHDADGSSYSGSGEIFTKVKVIVAPTSAYKGSRSAVNFDNYYETLRFFNLKDRD